MDSVPTGRLNLVFDENLVKNKNYIGELITNDTTFLCLKILNNITKIDSIPVGIYQFRMFKDENNNNNWDSGSIKLLKQPEEIDTILNHGAASARTISDPIIRSTYEILGLTKNLEL